MSIFIFAFIITIVNCIFWLLFAFLMKQESMSKNHSDIPVTILVCIKNGGEKIEPLVQALLNLEGNNEILLVDDFSTDKSWDIIASLSESNKTVKGIKSTIDIPGKKAALLQGFSMAQNDCIVCTDVDCLPVSSQWVRSMANMSLKEKIVLGYAPLLRARGFLNAFSRFETAYIAIQYLSFAKLGNGHMSIGRNVLYPKKLVKAIKLEQLFPTIPSGDDDLLFQLIHSQENTTISLDPNTFVYSQSKPNWSSYFNQKSRHLSSSKKYNTLRTWPLHLFSFSQIAFYSLCIIGLFLNPLWILNLFIIRTVIV